MSFLSTRKFSASLFSALEKAHSSAYLASAYITTLGIGAVLAKLSPKLRTGGILARWDARDLVTGASELEVYELVKARGFPFFVNPTLHAKFILLDETNLFLGSANCTAAGLALGVRGNWEAGTELSATEADRLVVTELFDDSVRMTDDLYNEIKTFIDAQPTSAAPDCSFPCSIAIRLQSEEKGLWVRELPWSSGPQDLVSRNPKVDHDCRSFEITSEILNDLRQVSLRFSQSRCCRWLLTNLEQNEGQLYFGQVSELLHDALLEDPKPYRKDVKILVSNLLNWSAVLLPDLVALDSPRYSQRIRLLISRTP